ncbi:MAG: hypothetical protein CL678_14155 [Bdellovibrionaceae bacterium]|nr:hypothetical protein [Pseudobdellovibrionaceae bacterium]|tara:strand:- start:4469 stop:5437 length:969 start_codon:yes stop_codon:yes gene_type:complete
MKFQIYAFIFVIAFSKTVFAEESYIDFLKKTMPQQKASEEGSYTENIKQKLPPPDNRSDYIEFLKSTDPKKKTDSEKSHEYTKKIRKKLKPKEELGAIEAVRLGKSELELVRSTDIRFAFSLELGATATRLFTAGTKQANNFQTIYGSSWVPDVQFGFEWKFFHSETWGSLGLMNHLGFVAYKGTGLFGVAINHGVSGSAVGNESETTFRFVGVPISTGLIYRMNVLHYVRPYIEGAGLFFGGRESRDDGGENLVIYGWGYTVGGGVNILLDPLSRKATWALYNESGVKHLYLTVNYYRIQSLGGTFQATSDAVYSGFTFEM